MNNIPRTTKIMWGVAAATTPSLIIAATIHGAALWQQLAATLAAALIAEACCLTLRRQPLRTLTDGSAIVAACILTIALPPHAPWWVAATAAASAITLAKHCYGGLGNNLFNPAMVGYALAFLAFPSHFAAWDATSAPTPLAAARLATEAAPQTLTTEALQTAAAATIGGIALILTRAADWRLTAAYLIGIAAVNLAHSGEWSHLLHGGIIFTAFFVITDPVTAATTRAGRWLYGIFVGALTLTLRHHGAHTDSIAFAILIGNMLAPLADQLTTAATKALKKR